MRSEKPFSLGTKARKWAVVALFGSLLTNCSGSGLGENTSTPESGKAIGLVSPTLSLEGINLSCTSTLPENENSYGEFACNIVDAKRTRIYADLLRMMIKIEWELLLDNEPYKNPDNVTSESAADQKWQVPVEIFENPKRLVPQATLRDIDQSTLGIVTRPGPKSSED